MKSLTLKMLAILLLVSAVCFQSQVFACDSMKHGGDKTAESSE